MKVKDLILQLKKYDEELEVRVLNSAIEDDESCPTFEIKSAISAMEFDDCFDSERDVNFVWIEIFDNEYTNN